MSTFHIYMANYIKNKDMLIAWNESLQQRKITPELEEMFLLLVKHVSRRFHYQNEDDRLDCQQTAYLRLFIGWKNFDPKKSTNAFAYGTEIVKRAFAEGYGYLYKRKGDPDKKIKIMSIEQANEGQGMYNL